MQMPRRTHRGSGVVHDRLRFDSLSYISEVVLRRLHRKGYCIVIPCKLKIYFFIGLKRYYR